MDDPSLPTSIHGSESVNKTTYDLSSWERTTKRRKACREVAELVDRKLASSGRRGRGVPLRGMEVPPLRPTLARHRCLPRRLNKMPFCLAGVQRVQLRVWLMVAMQSVKVCFFLPDP